ncbi:MAG: hypothetical protein ACLFVU_10520 [Phycisphaerae bacterium]
MDRHALNYFKKRAKHFVEMASGGDSRALQRFRQYYRDGAVTRMRAQHILAREAGFCSWKAFLEASDTEMQLAAVMDCHPLLCDHGMGVFNHWTFPPDDRQTRLVEERRILRASVDAVQKTRRWLRANVVEIKTINPGADSYHLKHLAEKEIDHTVVNGSYESNYISNGVLIAAALSEGYGHRDLVSEGSPNVEFAMSERSLKAIRKRQGRY